MGVLYSSSSSPMCWLTCIINLPPISQGALINCSAGSERNDYLVDCIHSFHKQLSFITILSSPQNKQLSTCPSPVMSWHLQTTTAQEVFFTWVTLYLAAQAFPLPGCLHFHHHHNHYHHINSNQRQLFPNISSIKRGNQSWFFFLPREATRAPALNK